MSLEFPDEDENRQKDYYIARCKVLRTFVDPMVTGDAKPWVTHLETASSKDLGEIKEIIGSERIENYLKPYLQESDRLHLFGKDLGAGDVKFLLESMICMGYEIGDLKGVYLFYGDIYEKMVFSETIRNTYEGSLITLDLLRLGENWRNEAFDDVPDAFKDFNFDLD